MKGKVKIITGVTAAIILVVVASSAVWAASPNLASGIAGWCQAGGGCGINGFGGNCLDEVSKLTGFSEAEIVTQRQAGKSLVEIAAAKNVSEEVLVAAILADRKTEVQQLVTAGTLTQERADLLLGQMESRIKLMVENTAAGSCAGGICYGGSNQGAGQGIARRLGGGGGCGMGGRGTGFGSRGGVTTK
jgi:hypothetical protein